MWKKKKSKRRAERAAPIRPVVPIDVRIVNELADLCYIIVHDFQEEVITEARAQVHHGHADRYRDRIVEIVEFARAKNLPVILDHAERTLELIDAPTFGPLDI